jgi:hypothetical protein
VSSKVLMVTELNLFVYRINWNTPLGGIIRGVPNPEFGPGGIQNDGGLK